MMHNQILTGDALSVLKTLPGDLVQCIVTSPPYYGLRDYGVDGQIGLESSPDKYVAKLVEVFREVRRVLREDGTCWVNLGDSYASGGVKQTGRNDENAQDLERRSKTWGTGRIKATATPQQRCAIKVNTGLKSKDLMMLPARVAIALQEDDWYLRSDIIWHKSNCMPESVTDRPTSAHEHIFLLAKSERYYYDADAIKETAVKGSASAGARNYLATADGVKRYRLGQTETSREDGRNKRNVWTVPSQPYPESHFATFPPKLIEPCILAGSRPGDIVLDPFMGAGTTALVALQHGRDYLGIELNPAYVQLAERRIATVQQHLWTSEGEVA